MAHDNHDNSHDYAPDRVPSDLLQQMGYETRDVAPQSIGVWIFGLFVFVGIVSLGMVKLYDVFVPKQLGQTAYEAEIFRTAPIRNMPPQPQLQTWPKRDMIMYRRDEYRNLTGYNVTQTGKISVPIDTAIDDFAAKGISGVTASKTAPKVDAYPGSGNYQDAPQTVEAKTPAPASAGEQGVAAPNAVPDVNQLHTEPTKTASGAQQSDTTNNAVPANTTPAPRPAASAGVSSTGSGNVNTPESEVRNRAAGGTGTATPQKPQAAPATGQPAPFAP